MDTLLKNLLLRAKLVQDKIFTAETLRAQRGPFLFGPVQPEQTKSLQPLAGHLLAAGHGVYGESASPDSP